ncbi:prephenate dehydratase [Mycolicibacterium phlei]|jgi:hypothetical protein|uniref:Prephenate dehydratase n=1 Tax=Mycolicibacterium phlei DSM 43239 = CCUG 21000 TaxID=1226750 RepID=A0A5N5V5R0_MYCPH|nr:DUF2470 domain-containing protein [Mycolicibacterium phlei]VEG07158.1 prephenate dehydratase [Mycobacteroides chelonae]AMO59026.1 hypothetical protein MPHLCCUG_00180 [Mycolicibacterium phlei]KAB7757251.1 prephenate dehydratase [Mycolicibacterium phlei DSM 43239 = CCUG 21000]KXW59669.1 prephenate dehydratase [Mycolicibacterium phlei DSM 43070]KXW65093.1 prephenate dehydratase [Mycolicibacterium phlei DSM 43239 = CCUG 21000]
MTAAITAPTTAERIRSACAKGGDAMLAVDGVEPTVSPVHHLLDDGSFAVTVRADSPVAATAAAAGVTGAQAVLELTDYAPLPLREPVRSLVWIRGRLHAVPDDEVPALLDLVASEDPNPALLEVNSSEHDGDDPHTLLRLEIESVVVADSTGAESVGVGALLSAQPDPFCAMESGWLQHLESAHRDVIDRLATRLPAALRRGRVRPLGLDRYGVRLRVEAEDGDHDVRLPFTQPVDDVPGLSRAIRILMGCPFLNGLRARRI